MHVFIHSFIHTSIHQLFVENLLHVAVKICTSYITASKTAKSQRVCIPPVVGWGGAREYNNSQYIVCQGMTMSFSGARACACVYLNRCQGGYCRRDKHVCAQTIEISTFSLLSWFILWTCFPAFRYYPQSSREGDRNRCRCLAADGCFLHSWCDR